MENKYYRQGDVLFIRVKTELKSTPKKLAEYTVQHGEATGHHHTLYSLAIPSTVIPPHIELFEEGNTRFIKLDTEWLLRHQEHKEHIIPPGTYEIRIEEEFDPADDAIRQVID